MGGADTEPEPGPATEPATGPGTGLDDGPDPVAVLAAFGLPGRPVEMLPVPGAFSNRVYRLLSDTGGSRVVYAVKELHNRWMGPNWRRWIDSAFELEVTAERAGVAVPQPVPNPSDGSCVAWVPAGASEAPVRVHHWLDGRPHGPATSAPEVAAWAGKTLATLHGLGVPATDRSVYPAPHTDTADCWPELVERLRIADPALADAADSVSAEVEVIADLVRAAGHQPDLEVMTHGDVDQKNLLLTPTGPALCDWDVAAPLLPRRELADVAMSLARWRDQVVASEVIRAYGAYGGEVVALQPRDLGQTMMSGLDWVVFNVERAVGDRPASPAEASRSQQLALDLLAELPHRVDVALGVHRLLV